MTCAAAGFAADEPAAVVAALREPPSVRVDVTPVHGLGLPQEVIPSNVQVFGREAVEDAGSLNLPDLLMRRATSVHVNEIQGNPYQADLNFRGYTASPLLGTPQGLSVYLDGVRINQPFGDVVSWDLIPRMALTSMSVMPGSNPVFGLNTLGGAIVLQTRDGHDSPGTTLQVTAGRFGRASLEFQHGGSDDGGRHWYVAGNVFREKGWRVDSPSRVDQLFAKVGMNGQATDVTLSVALAGTGLNGNGLQEVGALAIDYASVYSRPDVTKNRSLLINLAGTHRLSEAATLSGNAYLRRIDTTTFNGDVNEDSLDQSVYQPNAAERAALAAAGYSGFPVAGATAANTPFPFWRCIANALRADEPAEKCNGLINRTETRQTNFGATGQLTLRGELAGYRHQLSAGIGADASRMRFRQGAQFGYLLPDRGIVPVNAFADGTYLDDNGNPIDSRVDLEGRTRTFSVFATDTVSFGSAWHLTASARYNHTTVSNRDRITPGGGAGSLDGDHRFGRLNPALGLAWTPRAGFSAFAGVSEGSRTPTAVELGCADPANPCKLPNAMAGDPPLKQVVTRTWEAGVRGRINGRFGWNASVFRADNFDDILFVADNAAGFGYFKNFGHTRRQGLEVAVDGRIDRVGASLAYTFLDATYQSGETVNGSANSSSNAAAPGLDGNIVIRPADRLPLIPRHILKLRADWQVAGTLALGLGMSGVSSSIARGNENNQHQSDGVRFLGPGRAAGYAVFDFSARYRPAPRVSLFAQVNNLFDRRYATAAQLGANAFGGNGGFVARPFPAVGTEFPLQHSTFVAPGAPRSFWIGIRLDFDS